VQKKTTTTKKNTQYSLYFKSLIFKLCTVQHRGLKPPIPLEFQTKLPLDQTGLLSHDSEVRRFDLLWGSMSTTKRHHHDGLIRSQFKIARKMTTHISTTTGDCSKRQREGTIDVTKMRRARQDRMFRGKQSRDIEGDADIGVSFPCGPLRRIGDSNRGCVP
jgi:hypothetical protein